MFVAMLWKITVYVKLVILLLLMMSFSSRLALVSGLFYLYCICSIYMMFVSVNICCPVSTHPVHI